LLTEFDMHNCRETKKRIVDLAIGEAGPGERSLLLEEIESCLGCREAYQSTADALLAVDRAAEAAMPDERFWAGYHVRLRHRIAHEVLSAVEPARDAPIPRRLLVRSWWLPAAAAAALAVLALGAWAALRERRGVPAAPPAVAAEPKNEEREPAGHEPPGGGAPPAPTVASAGPDARPRPAKRRRTEPRRVAVAAEPEGIAFVPSTVVSLETARHLERTQMLLRSFRNAAADPEGDGPDVAYERERSRELLNTNVILRRTADGTNNVLAGEVLGKVEPFLLDISNLPDRPEAEEIESITERMQRTEILTELLLFSAEASNRSH
jgi:hypothetical protein